MDGNERIKCQPDSKFGNPIGSEAWRVLAEKGLPMAGKSLAFISHCLPSHSQ